MTLESVKKEIALRRKNKKEVKKKTIWTTYFTKTLITIFITLILLIAIKGSKSFEKNFYKYVYEDTLPFAKINEVYKEHFGSSIPFFGIINNEVESVFKEELKYSKKEKYKDGVALTVSKNYLVPTLESGMVVFIGNKDDYSNVVIVQQVNGIDLWYVNIKNVSVALYDYVEAGSLLGEVNDTTLVLVYKKDGKVVDYEKLLN